MKIRGAFIALASALAVSGCMNAEIPTRLEPMDIGLAQIPGGPVRQRSYDIQSVTVIVPQSLAVSEANSYYPSADIVWRGDPYGDRHEQLRQIFQDAANAVAPSIQGSVPVNVTIVLERFHGVTEKTRFSVGGYYAMTFAMTVTDAETGIVIEGPREIEGSLAAPGGDQALALDHAGQTEKVRVSAYLRELFLSQWAS